MGGAHTIFKAQERLQSSMLLQDFSNLLHKYLPPTHLFHKIFKRNTVKRSYSCMRTMNFIISDNICAILNPPKNNYGSNCRDNANCPLQNHCLTSNSVYWADVSNNVDNEKRVCLEVSETPFKEKYSNHVRNDKHERYCNATELSKYVWEIKRIITFVDYIQIILLIIKFPNQHILLNKRYEFVSKCWHENNLLIANMK